MAAGRVVAVAAAHVVGDAGVAVGRGQRRGDLARLARGGGDHVLLAGEVFRHEDALFSVRENYLGLCQNVFLVLRH